MPRKKRGKKIGRPTKATGRKPGRPPGSGTKSLRERFSKFVTERGVNDCWFWTGGTSSDGHGRIWDGKTVIPAHHAAYLLAYGKRVPAGKYLKRTCDEKLCMNPRHFIIKKPGC